MRLKEFIRQKSFLPDEFFTHPPLLNAVTIYYFIYLVIWMGPQLLWRAWNRKSSQRTVAHSCYKSHKTGIQPVSILGLYEANVICELFQICCGDDYCLAMSERGEIFAWGGNYYGQLGTCSTSAHLLPARIASNLGKYIHLYKYIVFFFSKIFFILLYYHVHNYVVWMHV